MNYNAKEGTINFDGYDMDYLVFGKGTLPLVIVQGLNLTGLPGGYKIQPIRYELYAKNFRVYMVDRRRPLPESITVEDIAKDVADGLRILGVDNAYVIGNSQGGMIAQYLAINYPKLVKKLVLNVTTCEVDPVLEKNVKAWVEEAKETGDLDSISVKFTDLLYPPDKVPKVSKSMARLYAMQKRRPPEDFIKLAEACLTVDTYDRLGEIKCPVRVMGGRKDMIISPESSLKLAEALGTEPILFDDLGHAAYETPEYQKKVLEFLLED